jgi:peptidoglycan-N-acetylglucosamine deacetylase
MHISYSPGDWLPLLRTIENAPDAVALSIDDGPTPETTPRLLELLREFDAQATFFLSGVRARQFPELVVGIVRAGHDIFAHGWEHVRLEHAGAEEVVAAMEKCERLLRRFRPTPIPYLVRLPYGSGHRSRHVHRSLRCWNPTCQIAHWQLGFEDYRLPPLCPVAEDVRPACQRTVARVLTVNRLPGSILILHDNPFDVTGPHKALVTTTFIEETLIALQARGLRVVPIKPRAKPHPIARFVLI